MSIIQMYTLDRTDPANPTFKPLTPTSLRQIISQSPRRTITYTELNAFAQNPRLQVPYLPIASGVGFNFPNPPPIVFPTFIIGNPVPVFQPQPPVAPVFGPAPPQIPQQYPAPRVAQPQPNPTGLFAGVKQEPGCTYPKSGYIKDLPLLRGCPSQNHCCLHSKPFGGANARPQNQRVSSLARPSVIHRVPSMKDGPEDIQDQMEAEQCFDFVKMEQQ